MPAKLKGEEIEGDTYPLLPRYSPPHPLAIIDSPELSVGGPAPPNPAMASYMMTGSNLVQESGVVHDPTNGTGNSSTFYAGFPGATDSTNWRSADTQEQSEILNEERQRALHEVDEAFFSRFHVKVVLIVGAGFFTDAYDVFVIDMVAVMLGVVYGDDPVLGLSSRKTLGLKVAAPIGTFVGMLLFGYLGDRRGRKKMYGTELVIIIFAVFVQALLGQAKAINIINALILWRFIMGVGIGGDYPTSAVIASEFAPVRTRGRMMTAVFATQGLGQLVGAIVSIIVVYAYKESLQSVDINDVNSNAVAHVDQMWRILLGFGCIPGAIALLFRLTIPETPRYTMDIERNVNQAVQDIETFLTKGSYFVDPDGRVEHVQAPKVSLADWRRHFSVRENLFFLIGTCYSWFALDIAFYGLSLNSSVILNGIFPVVDGDDSLWNRLQSIAVRNTIPICTGVLPGYVAAFFVVDRWGRRPLQFVGFAVLFVLLIIMGAGINTFTKANSDGTTSGAQRAFVALYCLASFFLSCGPNTTTFIIPGEGFPTRYRSTLHGVAAASGKLGAIISQLVVYGEINNNHDTVNGGSVNNGIKTILIVFAFFMLSGIGSTWLLPETKQRTLEDISNEEQANFISGPAQSTMSERQRA